MNKTKYLKPHTYLWTPSAHEKWRFWAINIWGDIWVITPKNEGFGLLKSPPPTEVDFTMSHADFVQGASGKSLVSSTQRLSGINQHGWHVRIGYWVLYASIPPNKNTKTQTNQLQPNQVRVTTKNDQNPNQIGLNVPIKVTTFSDHAYYAYCFLRCAIQSLKHLDKTQKQSRNVSFVCTLYHFLSRFGRIPKGTLKDSTTFPTKRQVQGTLLCAWKCKLHRRPSGKGRWDCSCWVVLFWGETSIMAAGSSRRKYDWFTKNPSSIQDNRRILHLAWDDHVR